MSSDPVFASLEKVSLVGWDSLELQSRVRHIENFAPELGPFFDRLVDPLDPTQFSASQALSRFMEIYNGLTREQLEEPVSTWLWKQGRLVKKYNYDELGLSHPQI